MLNVWPVDATASGWAGEFQYPGSALHGIYDWVRYTAGEDCGFETAPEPPPPPPGGDPGQVQVADITLALNQQRSQVIARATIRDGAGAPVAGAEVGAAWSGIITGGDTRRTTGADGVAVFYSARSRNSGEVSFCVTSVSAAEHVYQPSANTESCDSISK
jgi:hypothetical protein